MPDSNFQPLTFILKWFHDLSNSSLLSYSVTVRVTARDRSPQLWAVGCKDYPQKGVICPERSLPKQWLTSTLSEVTLPLSAAFNYSKLTPKLAQVAQLTSGRLASPENTSKQHSISLGNASMVKFSMGLGTRNCTWHEWVDAIDHW